MSARAVSAPLAQLPNALTVLRLLLIPVFVAALLAGEDGFSVAAAVIFGVAGATDQIDGWLARRWHVESRFGKFADPLADRLIVDAAVILLWLEGRLPWVALALPARDVLLLGGFPLFAAKGYDFAVNTAGKVATWILYFAVVCVLGTHDGTDWPVILFWIGLGTAAVAALMYAVSALREVKE